MYAVAATDRVSAVDSGERAQRVKERREALGMKITDLAKEAGVNRGQLGEYEAGKHAASEPWVRKVENTLERIETEVGMGQESHVAERPDLIRIEVQGVYGAKALIVEGSPDNQEQLEAMVDRIMRNLRNDEDEDRT